MIKKIQTSEYLKRYDNMGADERVEFLSRVEKWLGTGGKALADKTENFDSRLKDAMTMSVEWNDAECTAYEEGVILLSAFMSTEETWLPNLIYTVAVRRCVRRMIKIFSSKLSSGEKEQENDATQVVNVMDLPPLSVDALEGTEKPQGRPAELINIPARPKHIDQYVHLLPKPTQDRAAKYGPLMRELDELRKKESLLMDDASVGSKDREAIAKQIIAVDNEIGDIKKELDSEWAKLVKEGRVVVDDLGIAHEIPSASSKEVPEEKTDSCNKNLTSAQKARRRDLRKWLVDTRRGTGNTREEHINKWKESFKEFYKFDGDKVFEDKKIVEAAKHYGVNIKEISSSDI